MKARVTIELDWQLNRCVIRNAYANPPFRLMDISPDRGSDRVELMLMSSAPGMMDADFFEWEIQLAPRSTLQLHTQSYQRIFPATTQARQEIRVHVPEHATLIYLPHPAVPHAQSAYSGLNQYFLHQGSRLAVAEIITCGRKLNGEQFLFRTYQAKTEIYLNDELVVHENLLVMPKEADPLLLGELEGFTHQASLLLVGWNDDVDWMLQEVRTFLADTPDLEFGASRLPVKGISVRLLGNGAELLHRTVTDLAGLFTKVTRL